MILNTGDLLASGMKNSHHLAAQLLNQIRRVNLSVVQNCQQYVLLCFVIHIEHKAYNFVDINYFLLFAYSFLPSTLMQDGPMGPCQLFF